MRCHRLGGDRRIGGLDLGVGQAFVQIEELPAAVRPAIGENDAPIGTFAGDGVVGLVAVDLKDALEVEADGAPDAHPCDCPSRDR